MPFEPGRYQHLRGNVSWRRPSATPDSTPTDATAAHQPEVISRPSSWGMWREFAHLALSTTPAQTIADADAPLLPIATGA
jgi:hypothetical protein